MIITPDLIVSKALQAQQRKALLDQFAESIVERVGDRRVYTTLQQYLDQPLVEQFAEGLLRREKKEYEKYVPFGQIDFDLTHAHRTLTDLIMTKSRPIFRDMSNKIASAVANNEVVDVTKLTGSYDLVPIQEDIVRFLSGVYEYGKQSVKDEHERARQGIPADDIIEERQQGIEVFADDPTNLWFSDIPFNPYDIPRYLHFQKQLAIGLLWQLLGTAAMDATQTAYLFIKNINTPVGYKWAMTTALRHLLGKLPEVMEQRIQETAQKAAFNGTAGMVSEVFSVGRADEISAEIDGIVGGYYSALLDSKVCDNCLRHEGEFYEVGTPEFARYFDGNQGECIGKEKCRCMLALVFGDEAPASQKTHQQIYKMLKAPDMKLAKQLFMRTTQGAVAEGFTAYATYKLDAKIAKYYETMVQRAMITGNTNPTLEYLYNLLGTLYYPDADLLPSTHIMMPDGSWIALRVPAFVLADDLIAELYRDPKRLAAISAVAESAGMTVETYVSKADDAVQALLRSNEVALESSVAQFRVFLKSEDLADLSKPPVKDPLDFEHRVFGVVPDTPRVIRPIYGKYVATYDPDMTPEVRVILKPDVRSRATITFGKTLEGNFPSNVNRPSVFTGAPIVNKDILKAKSWQELYKVLGGHSAQVHGGLRLSDIQVVIFRDVPKQSVVDKLKELGIPWRLSKQAKGVEVIPRPNIRTHQAITEWMTFKVVGGDLAPDFWDKWKISLVDVSQLRPLVKFEVKKHEISINKELAEDLAVVFNKPSQVTNKHIYSLSQVISIVVRVELGIYDIFNEYTEAYVRYQVGRRLAKIMDRLGIPRSKAPDSLTRYVMSIDSEVMLGLERFINRHTGIDTNGRTVALRGQVVLSMLGPDKDKTVRLILGLEGIRKGDAKYDAAFKALRELLDRHLVHTGQFYLALERTMFDIRHKQPRYWSKVVDPVTTKEVWSLVKDRIDVSVPQLQVVQALHDNRGLEEMIKLGEDFYTSPIVRTELASETRKILGDRTEALMTKLAQDIMAEAGKAPHVWYDILIGEKGVPESLTLEDLFGAIKDSWAGGVGNPLDIALGRAASKLFADDFLRPGIPPHRTVNKLYLENSEIFDAIAQAMYNLTQKKLDEWGIGEYVYLWRGMGIPPLPGGKEVTGVTLSVNPLTSFTVNYKVASDFRHGMEGNVDTLVLARVPRDKIFAIPSTGLGSWHEGELIIIGHKGLNAIVWQQPGYIMGYTEIVQELDRVWPLWTALDRKKTVLIVKGGYAGHVGEILGPWKGKVRVKLLYNGKTIQVNPDSLRTVDKIKKLEDIFGG